MPIHDNEPITPIPKDDELWTIYTDGSDNRDGSGAGFVLTSPEGVQWEFSIRLTFTVKNNGAEYEALISALRQAQIFKADKIKVYADSQLMVMQVQDKYITKEPELIKYLDTAKQLIAQFKYFNIEHIPRDNNRHADSLAYLASKIDTDMPRVLRIEVQDKPAYWIPPQVNAISDLYEATEEEIQESWMQPFLDFLLHKTLPADETEAHKIQLKSKRYTIVNGRLYRRSASGNWFKCLTPKEGHSCLEIVHASPQIGNHGGGKSLSFQVMRLGYYWANMDTDAKKFVQKCDKCQRFGNILHRPPHNLVTIVSPWPFFMWGLDIVGPMHTSSYGHTHFVAATDYFTKWIEVAPLRLTTEKHIEKFIWDHIITRFGLPHTLVTDNGAQFCGSQIKAFYKSYGIQHNLSSPRYAKSNGQAEASNKRVLETLKKKLDKYKGKWVDELSNVLWAYRTTPRSSTGESPFSLCYGSEAIIPTEIAHPTMRSMIVTDERHQDALEVAADRLEARRDHAHMALARYQQTMRKHYNQGVATRKFLPGDLVLRVVFENTRVKGDGKLGANWEGPYMIDQATSGGAYHLKTMEGEKIQRPWNGMYLKHYFV